MKSRVCCWLLLLVAIATAARAQDLLFWPDAVDTVEVVAPRPLPEERILSARGFVQVVPLGSAAPAAADLGDLLDRAVGVQVRRYGGCGAVTLASVRGSSPSQVRVTINDTPISTAPDAVTNLSLLPVRLFERVEIARGPLAVVDGMGAAGVIRLVTPDEFQTPPRLRLGVGSFGTTSVSATAGGQKGPLSLLLAGGRLASEGDYRYLDRRGTPWNTADDETVRRQNNAFHQEDLLVQARLRPSRKVQVETTGHGLWKDSGIPGTENIQTERVHDRFRRWLQSLSVRADDVAAFDGKITAHLQEDVDRYRNLDGEVGLGRADFRNRLLARGITADLGHRAAWFGSSLHATGRLLREEWQPRNLLADGRGPTRERDSHSLSLELSVAPLSRRIEIFAREDWLVTEEMHQVSDAGALRRALRTPRLGCFFDVARMLRLRAGWGEFTRLPSFVELFGQGGIQQGNPKLQPEKGEGWDLGAILQWPFDAAGNPRLRSRLEIAYFETRTRDAIIWLQNSQRTTLAMNLERTRVQGAESLLRTHLRQRGSYPTWNDPAVSLDLAFTRIDARDDGPSRTYHGKVLPHEPSARASIETRLDLGFLRVVHLADYESELFRDRYNSAEKRRGPRMLHDIEATVPIFETRLEATLAVRNLTGRQSQDIDGFPVPGRSLFLELTASAFGRDAGASRSRRKGDD